MKILNNQAVFGKCVLAHWNCAFPGVTVSAGKGNTCSFPVCTYTPKCDDKGTQRNWQWNSSEMSGPVL